MQTWSVPGGWGISCTVTLKQQPLCWHWTSFAVKITRGLNHSLQYSTRETGPLPKWNMENKKVACSTQGCSPTVGCQSADAAAFAQWSLS